MPILLKLRTCRSFALEGSRGSRSAAGLDKQKRVEGFRETVDL